MQDRKIFIDTHVHTIHSELDGMCKLEDYVDYGKRNNFPALFVSDHGNISCWIPFYLQCKEVGIKPVLGSEVYISEGLVCESEETDKELKLQKENKLNFHLCLYAKDLTGYKNLIKLTTYANMQNFYRKPRITFDVLKKYSKGLICSTACVGSIFAYYLLKDEDDKAISYIKQLQDLFKDDFYIEYGYHYFESEKKYLEKLRRIAKDLNIKEIVANDTHYMYKEDELAHKILMCKGDKKLLDESGFDYSNNYYKSYTEINETFSEFGWFNLDKYMGNTFEIINKVKNYEIPLGKYIYPELKNEEDLSQEELLSKNIKTGLVKRYGNNIPKNVIDRTKYELDIIKKMNFSGYFNVVQDYIVWCKNNGIPVGPARGSGAGSIVNYILGITEVDPLKYDLIFERFLNPERLNFPDIDSDIEPNGRKVLVNHLIEKYGQNGCVSISTRGFLKGKSSIKVVASKLGLDFVKYNKFLSGIKDPSIDTVDKVVDSSEELTKLYKTDEEFKKVIDIAKKIEGSIQSISVHASAVCLETNDISDYVPIIRTKDGYATGWTDKIVEKCGLIKYDILGLNNLTVIDECCKLIGNDFDIKNIPLDDKKTFKDLQDGDNLGKFQIESSGMKNLLKRLQPENIDHISAILALYRPSSIQFIDEYIKCKKDPSKVKYIDDRIKPILEKTYGQMLYQEQVMSISRVLAGYTMAEADSLRRAIGKKIMSEMLQHESKFIEGCVNNGVKREVAEKLYRQIVEFARYSFNLSHSVAYSFITYQTAYLKSNYPLQFMCALLNHNSDDLDKLNLYIGEVLRLGINILPPDVNISTDKFVINEEGAIVFGLNAIKGLGKTAVNQIIKERKNGEFKSITDFIERTTKVDKSNIQALLRVGAFNTIEKNPKRWDKLVEHLTDAKNSKYYQNGSTLEDSIYSVVGTKLARKSEKYLELVSLKRGLSSTKRDKLLKDEYTLKQDNVIKNGIESVQKHYLQFITYMPSEKISNEQELLGFNISTNPYKRWNNFKKYFIGDNKSNIKYVEMNDLFENSDNYINLPKFTTVGLLSNIKEIKTKKGGRMAKLTLEYYGVKTDITVFPKQWENNIEFKIQKGNLLMVVGRLVETNKQYSTEDYEIRLDSLRQLNVLVNENNKCIIDLTGKNVEDVNMAIKRYTLNERQENLPVERVVMLKYSNGYKILNGLHWVNNPEGLAKSL